MQSLAAYLLERTVNSEDEKISLLVETRKHLNNWLKEKGVADPAGNSGEFISVSSSETGNYKRETAVSNYATSCLSTSKIYAKHQRQQDSY